VLDDLPGDRIARRRVFGKTVVMGTVGYMVDRRSRADPPPTTTQWSADGRWLYVRRFEGLPTKVYRVDLQTGRRELWKEFLPANSTGVTDIESIYLTPDGTSYVYCYQRSFADLYLAEGLR
jgi:hypothetical protein